MASAVNIAGDTTADGDAGPIPVLMMELTRGNG
jgi:hypothetical protein